MQLAVAFGASGLFSGMGMMKFGLLAASAVGSFMLRKKVSDKEAGKLNDLKVSASTYGKGIPMVWGTMRTTGNMIWATDFDEEKHYYNSKGKDITGKKKDSKKGKPVYEYFANFAMALCEGPVEDLLRVWADGNLIYDKLNPNGYTDNNGIFHEVVGVGFTQHSGEDQGKGGKTGGAKKGHNGDSGRFSFRFYPGTEDQMPDDFMQGRSARPCPAYRGMCYLFFEHFALADFGNRTPTITAEVVVRRQRKPDFAFLKDIDPPTVSGGFSNGAQYAYADPFRQRLYVVARNNDTTTNGQHTLRVYDLTTYKEIKQIPLQNLGGGEQIPIYSQIHQFQGYGTGYVDTIIGVTAGGMLVGIGPTSNSCPVFFIDPNSLTVVGMFGLLSADLDDHDNSIVYPTQAAPIATMDPISKEITPYTVVMSMQGQCYFFGPGNSPDSFLPDIGTVPRRIIPGLPGMVDSFFFLTESYSGRNYIAIWKRWWPGGHDPSPMESKPSAQVFKRTYDQSKGDYGIGMADPFVLTGPKCLGVLWCLNSHDPIRDGLYVTKIDAETGDMLWEQKISTDSYNLTDNGILQQTPVINANKVVWLRNMTVWEIDFFQQTIDTYDLPTGSPAFQGGQAYWSTDAAVLYRAFDSSDGNKLKWVMGRLDRQAQTGVRVKDICYSLGVEVGIDPERLNFAQMNDDEVIGYILENPTPARAVVEDLSKVFMFDVIESDNLLKFVSRGQDPIVTITQDDLGVITDGPQEGAQEYYKETKVQEIDCPARVDVSFVNSEKEYENGTQGYQRPRSPMAVLQTKEKLDLNYPIAMNPDMAKQLAQKACMSIWAERISHDFVLPWTYLIYDPTDVATFQMNDGLEFTDRLIKMDIGADYSLQVSGVTQTPSTYSSDLKGNRGGGTLRNPRTIDPLTFPMAWDIPYVDDGDASETRITYYWGAAAYNPGFRYAALEERTGTSDWDSVNGTNQDLLWGTISGVVPVPPNGAFATDTTSKITLFPAWDFGDKYEWTSVPDTDWPSTDNAIVIGSELIYFKNATVQANGAIVIDTLIRGARGTEEAAQNHQQVGESWALVNLQGFGQQEEPLDRVGMQYVLRTQSAGLFTGASITATLNLTGASLKPYAPVNFKRVDHASSVDVTWMRRTRLGGNLQNGTDTVPLNEETESYDAFLLSTAYGSTTFDPTNPSTYKRAFLNLTSPAFTYTADQIAADGFVMTGPLYVVVFQKSAKVGRGFPGYATLTHSILS